MSAHSRGAHSGPRRRASWLLARYRTFMPPAHQDERTDPGHPGLPAQAGLISPPSPVNSRPPPELDGYRRGGESEPDVPAALGDPGQVDPSRLAHPGDPPAPVRSEEKRPDGPPAGPRRRFAGAFSRLTLLRICGAAVVLGLVTAGLLSGGAPSTSAESTVQSFLLSWEQGHYLRAAQLTTGDPAFVGPRDARGVQPDRRRGSVPQHRADHPGAETARRHSSAPRSISARTARHGTTPGGSGCSGRARPGRSGGALALSSPACARGRDWPSAPAWHHGPRYWTRRGGRCSGRRPPTWSGVRPDRLPDPAATAEGIGPATGLNTSRCWARYAPLRRVRSSAC